MKKLKEHFQKILDSISNFYKQYSHLLSWVFVFFVLVLLFMTIYHQTWYQSNSSFLKFGIKVILIFCTFGALLVLGDLLRMSLRWIPTYTKVIEDMVEKNWRIKDVLYPNINLFKERYDEAEFYDERMLVRCIEEVTAVVYGEFRYQEIFSLLQIVFRALILLFFFTLFSINLSCFLQAPLYEGLEISSDFWSYWHNAFYGMFVHRYVNPPNGIVAQVVGIMQIITGMTITVVALNLIISGQRDIMNTYRDAIRNYFILSLKEH